MNKETTATANQYVIKNKAVLLEEKIIALTVKDENSAQIKGGPAPTAPYDLKAAKR